MTGPTTSDPVACVGMTMTTRDGVPLATDVWSPLRPGPHPVLLMRQPYGRAIASTVTLAHPAWYAARGFIVAVQDVRGTGGSGGRFRALVHEAADGAAAVAWARTLPGSSGRVGLYGLSYQATAQYLALAGGARPEAIAPAMGPWAMWPHFASEGEALVLDRCVLWAMQMAAVAARQQDDGAAIAAFAAVRPDFAGDTPALPTLARDRRDLCHLADWVEADGPGPFWDAMSPAAALSAQPEALRTPAVLTGGWFDWFLPGTLAAFAAHRAAGAPCRLVIGPWTHLNWGGAGFGEAAASPVDALQADWFDRFLRGAENGADAQPALRLFDLLAQRWHDRDDWPTKTRRLHLSGDGRAAAASSGRLTDEAPADTSAEWLVADPWRPVPAHGGHLAGPHPMADRAEIDGRGDVAVFETAPLAAPLPLCGPVGLTLTLASAAPSLDVSAVLSVRTGDGAVRPLTQGFRRLDNPHRSAVAVDLRATCATVPAGARLRLSLAGAAFPAFAINPGTGARPETARAIDRAPIAFAALTGGAQPSHLTLTTV